MSKLCFFPTTPSVNCISFIAKADREAVVRMETRNLYKYLSNALKMSSSLRVRNSIKELMRRGQDEAIFYALFSSMEEKYLTLPSDYATSLAQTLRSICRENRVLFSLGKSIEENTYLAKKKNLKLRYFMHDFILGSPEEEEKGTKLSRHLDYYLKRYGIPYDATPGFFKTLNLILSLYCRRPFSPKYSAFRRTLGSALVEPLATFLTEKDNGEENLYSAMEFIFGALRSESGLWYARPLTGFNYWLVERMMSYYGRTNAYCDIPSEFAALFIIIVPDDSVSSWSS